jgi:hypothetical protein
MNEVFPLVGGLVIGLLLRRGNLSRVWAAAAALAVAVTATVISSEFMTSWGFVLVDIPLVLVSAGIGYLAWSVVEARRRRDTSTGPS